MKKIYMTLSCGLLLILLGVGIQVISQNGFPIPTWKGVLDGSYSKDCQTQFEKDFPEGELLQEINLRLNGFYKFSALSQENEVQLIIQVQNDAADHGAALETEAAPTDASESVPDETTAPMETTDTAEPTEPTEPTEPAEPTEPTEEPNVETFGQILLLGNRAMEVPYVDYDRIHNYADAVTKIAEALEGVQTYSVLVPNASEFYSPASYHADENSQRNMIDYAYQTMGEGVHTVDAYSVLEEHQDEYIYFRTDHHWTQLGAYYAYTALCNEMGYVAQPLSKFEQGQYDNFVGSMYSFLSDYPQREVLKQEPDTVVYYKPYRETKAAYYDDASLSWAGSIGVINYIAPSVSNKYLCFLGGDHPVTILETDVDGPVCLLIKESYGNAFAPWLTSHFSKIICIDPREFNRDGKPSLDLESFAERMEVDVCIVLNYPMMLNSGAYVQWLNRLVS